MTDLAHNRHDDVSAWHADRARDYTPVKHKLPVQEESIIQLGRGELLTDTAVLSTEAATLIRIRVNLRSVGTTVMNPDFLGFALPVSWSEGQIINGDPVRDRCIYLVGDSLFIRGDRRETLGIILRREQFIETLAALRGIAAEDARLPDRPLELTPAAAENLRTQLIAEFDGDNCRLAAQDLQNELFGLMINAYLRAGPEFARNASRFRQSVRIVRKAEEHFMAAEGKPVSLADLCLAAGVSKSTLYLAFQNVCGDSPLAYFHKRRLTQARSILLNSPAERGVVKRAALEVGLTEFGRFSIEYRRLFGESPSVTLSHLADR